MSKMKQIFQDITDEKNKEANQEIKEQKVNLNKPTERQLLGLVAIMQESPNEEE